MFHETTFFHLLYLATETLTHVTPNQNICLIHSVYLDYLVHDAEDNGVYEADSSHSHQTQQEEVGITVQLEVGGFGVKYGAHQLAFGCAETWVKKLL